MNTEPSALGVPNRPRPRLLGRIVLAEKMVVRPGERCSLSSFAFSAPGLKAALSILTLSLGADALLSVRIQTSCSPGNWSEHPSGRQTVSLGLMQLAPVSLDASKTRVVLENSGGSPAVVGLVEVHLTTAPVPNREEIRDVG